VSLAFLLTTSITERSLTHRFLQITSLNCRATA